MIKNIPHKDVKFYTNLIQDYLDKKESILPLVNGYSDAILEKINTKLFSIEKRKILVSAISNQYSKAKIEVPKGLHLLESENTFTVTTGHQLNLFGGPLFFIYKIVETIKLADELNKKSDSYSVVPIFWMASEDHDFGEINSINSYGKKTEWKTNQTGAVGRFIVDDALIEEGKKLLNTLEQKPFSNELKQLLDTSYIKGDTLSNCTRKFVSLLFKDTNLVIIDGDDVALKQLAKDIFLKELREQTTFSEVSKTNDYLKQKGYQEQVFVREINLFYLSENNRERIEKNSNGNFTLVDSKNEISEIDLENSVEKISPNALMRPLYQETILPNLVYIGGAGEISYWMQLKSNFTAFNLDFPVLSVRNSILNIDASTSAKLEKLALSEADMFKPIEELKNDYVRKNSTQEINLEEEILGLKTLSKNLSKKIENIDPTLVPKANSIVAQAENAINDLEKRLLKAQKQKFDVSLSQIEKLKEKLFPNNIFQERSESFAFYYSVYGNDFLKEIYNTITPFENSIKVRIDE